MHGQQLLLLLLDVPLLAIAVVGIALAAQARWDVARTRRRLHRLHAFLIEHEEAIAQLTHRQPRRAFWSEEDDEWAD